MTNFPSGTVTFLFTDIEGSTKLAREHSETWETLRSSHHQILREAIESNNGFVFQVIGDAFCAAFHKAGDALQAAVKAQQGLQNEAWGDCVIRARMGLHTGEAELHNNEYQGYLTLSLVQRIMSAGHGGQILLSNVTENLLRGQLPKEVNLRDMGEHTFKDVPYAVRVFQVLEPNLKQEFPALRVQDVHPNNLPTQLTSFIGREKEVADVKRLLENTHLLTLIGPGGTGKTRLSLQVAVEVLHAYPHGVWFIELAPISNPSSVPAAALTALGLPAEVHRPAIDMLCDYLREKEALLILDNCEHLVEACARMVDRLLHAAPKLRILTSSRESLGIAGEVSYRVPSLELPDIKQLPSLDALSQYEAVKLFIDRARAAQPTFNVTNENAPAVAQICHRLDGIPLALELAAAKVRALSVEQISKRLDDRFRLLTGGSRTALERHQTLRATLDWSYNLLPENEQVLFRRLSIFISGWTLEAAESVCSNETIHSEDVFELLEQLVNKSLVIAEDWQHETRYRMLETMRQYANEKLIEAGESEKLRDRHLDYYLNLAETAAPHLIRPEQLEWLDRLEADNDNLRLALEWALGKERPEPALRLCAALGRFWQIHCYWLEGSQWLARALQKAFDPTIASERTARAAALSQQAAIADDLDDSEKMKASAEESLALLQASTDRRNLGIARFHLAHAYLREGDNRKANELFEQSLIEFQHLKDAYWESMCQSWLSSIQIAQGKRRPSEEVPKRLENARRVGERLHLLEWLLEQAGLEWVHHRIEEAESYLKEAEGLRTQLGYKGPSTDHFHGLIAYSQKDYHAARGYFEREIDQFELLGEKNTRSFAFLFLGLVAREENVLDMARENVEQAVHLAREFGSRYAVGFHLAVLGYLDFFQDKLEDAKRNFKEALANASQGDDQHLKHFALIYLASGIANWKPEVALSIVAALDARQANSLENPMGPFYQREQERVLAQARLKLNTSAFDAACAEGEKMTIDEAIDLALKTLNEI